MWSVLKQSAVSMAAAIRKGQTSSVELMTAHLEQIQRVNPALNAVTELLMDNALAEAVAADDRLRSSEPCGPLHGVPVSIKDSIEVRGTRSTAGTLGRKNAAVAAEDATVVRRLREAGAIPIAKTNLPDLLFAFESDNLIFGRTNNPYDLTRTAGGSSGGESALIAACGAPLGLGSDAAGSVRVPAHFCGIASIKPTSGRLPRTGHVPPAGGWIEAVWQIGPMARYTEDLVLAMRILAGPDGRDFTALPVPLRENTLTEHPGRHRVRVAFFTDNRFAPVSSQTAALVERAAQSVARAGLAVEECRPPGLEAAYELELALLGADGGDAIDQYLKSVGSWEIHPLLTNGFLRRLRGFKKTIAELGLLWAHWDEYRAQLARFFERYDAILCPVYTGPALFHGDSVKPGRFEGFSHTMAWNVAGTPAAVVRCGEEDGLPLNIQVVTRPWEDMLALELCQMLEDQFGGWQAPLI